MPRLLRRIVRFVFPGLNTFRVAWAELGKYRPRHFRPISGLWQEAPLLGDRSASEIDRINERSRRYFEEAASHDFWLNRPFSDRPADPSFLWRFGLLVSALRIQPAQRVLDFGCGSGWASIMLGRMGATVVGTDIAPAALDVAREAAALSSRLLQDGDVRFQPYTGGRIEAPDEYFDHAVMLDAFHHLPHPRSALEELHRVLAPHGCLAFSEPGIGHGQTESSRAERGHGVLEEDVDIESLYRTALAAGFRSLDVLIPPLPPEILTLPFPRLRLYLRGLTWLVPGDFLRREILTGPMGVLRKGPYRVTSLSPRAQRARLRPSVETLKTRPGEEKIVPVRATNLTETAWLREGRYEKGYVRLGAQLMNDGGAMLNRDFARCELPKDVAESETVQLELRLVAPEELGRYRIRLDMVNEGICWFEDRGSVPADLVLDVI